MAEPTSFGSLLAGAGAATVVDGLIFPLDTIKTRSQAPGGLSANGGYAGLYRGIASVASCTIPSAALFFFSYEKFKGVTDTLPHMRGWRGHLVSSAAAEALSCAVLAPAEIVKQRAQVSATKETSVVILRDLLRGRDLRGLWHGYVGLLARNVPVTAIQFVLYENFKGRYKLYKKGSRGTKEGPGTTGNGMGKEDDGKKKKEDRLSAIESGMCAGASGSIAAAITTPMDVVKTRVMIRKPDAGGESSAKGGMLNVGRTILREEGVRALFRGLGLRVVWTSLGLSLYLGSYEAMKNYIDG